MSDGNAVSRGGDIISVPSCSVCGATETPETPLTEQPDGTYLCSIHLAMQQQKLGNGVSALKFAPSRPQAPLGTAYADLGLPLDATADEIEQAYKFLLSVWQPLRNSPKQRGEAAEMLERIHDAHDILTDPVEKAKRDEEIKRSERVKEEKARHQKARLSLPLLGNNIETLDAFERFCEGSLQNWLAGEGSLTNNQLYIWVAHSLEDDHVVRLIADVQAQTNLSPMRKLNSLLYLINPERPYQFYYHNGVFNPIGAEDKLATVEALIAYADKHWDQAIQHLYYGELITWLEAKADISTYGHLSYDQVRDFYNAQIMRYAATADASIGLEKLLEFLDNKLLKPNIRVAFNGQANSYTLRNWDGEIGHRPVTMTVSNTTRGYYKGQVKLMVPTRRQLTTAPWFSSTPLARQLPPPPPNVTRPVWVPQEEVIPVEFRGEATQTITFNLGYFNILTPKRDYTREITLTQHEKSPEQVSDPNPFPITFQLMPYLGGYRRELWLRGLRGGFPGLLLNGGIAYLLGWLLVAIGLLFAPHNSWLFFSHETDFSSTGSLTALGFLDYLLALLLRPFYYAIATLGNQTPNLLALIFGLSGLINGWRRGHSDYTEKQDEHMTRLAGRWASAVLATLTAFILILNLSAHAYPVISIGGITVTLIAFIFNNPSFYPPDMSNFPWNGFAIYAVVFAGLIGSVARRVITSVRHRLYQWVGQNKQDLLNPPEKG